MSKKSLFPITRFEVHVNDQLLYAGPNAYTARKLYADLNAEGKHAKYSRTGVVVDVETADNLEELLPRPVYMWINAERIGAATPDNSIVAQELAELFPEYKEILSYFTVKNKNELKSNGQDLGDSAMF